MDAQGHAALWLGEEWGRQVTRALECTTGVAVVGAAVQSGSGRQYLGGRSGPHVGRDRLSRAAQRGSGRRAVPLPAAKVGCPGSLDLLLDVELPVILSFGHARLSLKDVIQLTTGSGEISS